MVFRFIFTLFFLAFVFSCAPKPASTSAPVAASESAYCPGATTYSSSWTISGNAVYYRRAFGATGGGPGLIGPASNTTLLVAGTPYGFPIRYAEVMVVDGSGNIVQCSNTDGSGNYSLAVPQSGGSYTLKVNSRGNNSHIIGSVLNDPTNKNYYSLSTSFTADSSKSLSQLVADYKGDILGGAFNIFDVVVKENEFLSTNSTACPTYYGSCAPYSPSIKCSVYWTKGFNPGSYVGSSSGLSFYLPGKNELYILGGINGDTDNSDTDHFDDSVIAHEYGHFIEDNFSKTDSPGGFHSGSHIIDPRLAWGEGHANFLSTAVAGKIYRDTYGNSDGSSTGYYFKVDFSTQAGAQDLPTRTGEGNFREFSITRSLYQILQIGGNVYSEMWATFTGPFKAASEHFRALGLFMEKHAALSGATSFASELTNEKQLAARTDYARPLVQTGGACTTLAMTYGTGGSAGFSSNSYTYDWLGNNDVYDYNHPGGAVTIQLVGDSGAAADLDLYVYQESYKYIYESSSCSSTNSMCYSNTGLVGSSTATGSILNSTYYEAVSATLSAGHYLIIVNDSDTTTNQTVNYHLIINGVRTCP